MRRSGSLFAVTSSRSFLPRLFARHVPLALSTLLVAVVGSVGCGGAKSASESSATAMPASDSSVPMAGAGSNPVDGPAIDAITAAGIRSRVSDGGGVTLVNLWATWCAPCRAEMPALLHVARAHEADGVRLMLVSVDFDDQLPAVRKFLGSHGVDQTTYLKNEKDETFINGIHPEWSGALPATLVYDRNGKLVQFWEGAADENRFEHAVIAALTSSNNAETRP